MRDLEDIIHNVWRDEFAEHVNIIIRLLQRLNDRFRVVVGADNGTLRLNGRGENARIVIFNITHKY